MERRARQSEKVKEFIGELCWEHAEEAWHLWDLRQLAVVAPHYTLYDLQALDERLESHIDALRLESDAGWAACANALIRGKGGHFFAASVLAFERCDQEKIDLILEKAVQSEEAIEGVICALGWLSWEKAEAPVKRLFASTFPLHWCIGLAACAYHRQDPGDSLDSALASDDEQLAAIALRAAGEIRQRNGKIIRWPIEDRLKSGNDNLRFRASWSGSLLGYEDMLPVCKTFVRPDFIHAKCALHLYLRKASRSKAIVLINDLSRSSSTLRLAIIGSGMLGDTVNIPWLLDRMTTPVQARIAAEAVCQITGVDMHQENLIGACPEGYAPGPNDDPKDNLVAPDPDEHLPWPNPEAFRSWWNQNKTKYPKETRLLLGKLITEAHLLHILQTGNQRQRAATALELAILKSGTALYNTAAPAWRQIKELFGSPKSKSSAKSIAPNYGTRPLAITAVNCITPIGLDARQTAASVRAGITRFRLDETYTDKNRNPIHIASIQGLSLRGDTPDRHLSDIAVLCQDILFERYFEKIRQWPLQAQLLLCASSEKRFGPDYVEACQRSLTRALAEKASSPSVKRINKGNASFHYAVQETAKLIQAKPDTMCVIGCIDSLLDNVTLSWFENTSSLKSSSYGRHSGLIPSEAIGFVIVEDLESAKAANKTILARITSLGLSEEPHSRASDQSGISKGLTEACSTALQPLKEQAIRAAFSDLNGEEDRAREWGIVRQRIFDKDQKQPPLWTPADTYGDISAASGGVMASIVAEGFKKNWLPSPVMLFCSDDFGSCGAAVLEKEI